MDGIILFEQYVECSAVRGGNKLNSVWVDAVGAQGVLDDFRQFHIAMKGFLAAT